MSKTQLIMPMVPAGLPITPRPPAKPKSTAELKNEYVSTLIGVLRDKGSKGEVDVALTERIEKLLALVVRC